ncbi:hypothetical protein DEH84_17025 [Aquabacterium olei]|uniref:diguanylate cyclase n=2 Tax=Aquabacterium olei TaxID=1296669 RepID=A0A2U8FWX0_9BURK|nr:hypothetical protein DEH84_17025 [Aquabacterium olei]
MRARMAHLLSSATPARRILLAVAVSLPFFLLVLFIHEQALSHPAVSPYLDTALVRAMQWPMLGASLINLGVAAWVWPRRDDAAPLACATLLVCLTIGGTYTLITILSGPYTSPPSLVLGGVLLVGLLLFDRRPVAITFAVCMAMLLAHDAGVLAGWWAYAPGLRPALFQDPAASEAWRGWRTFVFVSGFAVLLGLAMVLFARLDALHGQLDTLSHTDALTGLANRRRLMEALEAEVARQRRTGRPFCLVMIDADHFKRVNDTWGHLQGDMVLRGLGRLLLAGVRSPTDLAARLGGEEFALLLPDTRLDEAEVVCQRMREALARERFGDPLAPFTITVSMGGAVCSSTTSHQALREADQQLYLAKATGRNRICLRTILGAVA